jgi:DNA-binding Lrp family transcriptional regulator
VFSSRDLGFVTTLVTAKVARCTLGRVVKVVSSFPEVTHNYQRDNEYNLWFTLTAVSRRRVREVIASVKREPGVQSIVELPAVKYYKVEVKFSL